MNNKNVIQSFLILSVVLFVVKVVKSSECGISSSRIAKIVGGKEAAIREFPWQISLKRNRRHTCGGTLVHPKWIVTAAHCMHGSTFEGYTAEAGIHHLYLDNHQKQTRMIKKVVKHPEFSLERFRNDIALIEVDEPFKIEESDGFINTACLPEDALRISSGTVTASGWGKLKEENDEFNPLLQGVSVPVISDARCINLYTTWWSFLSPVRIDSKTMFCAGLEAGGSDACHGDSGGPAVQRIDGKTYLVGVISWGYGCARAGKPGVYTEVPYYIPWINGVINNKRVSNY